MTSIYFDRVSKSYDNNSYIIKDLTLEVNDGEFLVLVGPSGCGKSTTLRMLAGLEDITAGKILVSDIEVNNLPPGKREVGMVFQNYALYPHMTIKENLAFPLKIKKEKKSVIEERISEIADLVQLSGLLNRYPKQLSGGQRQRVALGRAIIRHPKVFLFDEPLSNLDAKLRTQMRNEIITLQRKLKITSIYVTHDQTEAMTMGDRIVLMNEGRIMQIGTPNELYNKPSNLFTAEFIGSPKINIFKGEHLELIKNMTSIDDSTVFIAIRPDYIELNSEGKSATIINIENLGHEFLYHFRIGNINYISRTKKQLDLRIDQQIGFDIDYSKILQYDENENLIND